jgi:hypothetical protein
VRRISCVFEKKKKGVELTKGGTGPLSSTKTRHPIPSDRTMTRGLGPHLPPVGPRQGGPMGLGPPLPPAGPQQFQAVIARPPLQ